MKQIRQFGFQGDVAFMRVSGMPKDCEPAKDTIVAHSETGHHHVASGCALFTTPDPFTCYLRLEAPTAEVTHLRPFDTHEPIELLGGKDAVWMVRRQREHSPWGDRMVMD